MKIKVKDMPYSEAAKLEAPKNRLPEKQSAFWRFVLKTASAGDLKKCGFSYTTEGMENIPESQPCLFLMNHSSFTDLEMVAVMLQHRQYHIICTDDGFVGKESIMRAIGCVPTRKFLTDVALVRNMKHCVDKLGSSVVMYPEASYSFDGTETPLPAGLGKCVKLLKVPVIMIKTEGAFLRDPLYNCLQKRDVKVSARMYCLLTPEQIAEKSPSEINEVLAAAFRYDHFRAQHEKGIKVSEPFRADGLERVLYKCACCGKEHSMKGEGTKIRCSACGSEFTLEEDGTLSAPGGSPFEYVPDWYRWEREQVREEIKQGSYSLDTPVDILMLVDSKAVYRVGEGRLQHSAAGFRLTGCDGQLDFSLPVTRSYSLYSDYYWYEIGDMVCIGDEKARYYCFPKPEADVDVAKVRLATEELFALQLTH